MSPLHLGATPDQIRAALLAVLPPGSAVTVAEPHLGVRNVGIDLPRAPRGTSRAVYEGQLHRALEGAGMLLAPLAIGPRAPGRIRGSVRVEAPSDGGRYTDAAHLYPAAPGVVASAMPFSPPPELVASLYVAHQVYLGNASPIPFERLSAEEQRALTAAAAAYVDALPRR